MDSNLSIEASEEQAVSPLAPYLGTLFIVLTLPGLMASLFCIYIVVKAGYLKTSSAAVYQSIFHLLICDTSQLLVVTAFGVFAAIGASDLVDIYDIHGFLVCVFFHVNCSLLILITAFNRYMSVCQFSHYNSICTKKNMTMACYGSWVFCACYHAVIFYLTPCCHFMVSYRHFTLKWRNPNNMFLYSDYFMHMPYDIVTISLVIIFYGLVIRKVKRTNRSVAIKSQDVEKRQAQEMRITIQFLVISALVLPVPILLRLFPVILPEGVLTELNILLITGAMANSSINAIIYLAYNEDIKRKAKEILGLQTKEALIGASTTKGLVSVTHVRSQNEAWKK